jgi:hypothetical protein
VLVTLAALPARATLHTPNRHAYLKTFHVLANRGYLTSVLVAKRAGHGDKRVAAPIRFEIGATSQCALDANEHFARPEFRLSDIPDFNLPGFN